MSKEEEEECPEGDETCGMNAGVGIALRIAKVAEVPAKDIEDIKNDLFGKKITIQEAMDKIKERLPDDFHRGLVEEAEELMKEEMEKRKPKTCVSLIVKTEMTKQIDDWLENRELPPEVVENLERSKKAIDEIETCEAE